jgi:hypothetical protein
MISPVTEIQLLSQYQLRTSAKLPDSQRDVQTHKITADTYTAQVTNKIHASYELIKFTLFQELSKSLQSATGKLYAVKCDISNESEVLAAFKGVKDNLGGVDILINNAGVLTDTSLTGEWHVNSNILCEPSVSSSNLSYRSDSHITLSRNLGYKTQFTVCPYVCTGSLSILMYNLQPAQFHQRSPHNTIHLPT